MYNLLRYTSLRTECLCPPNAYVEGLIPRAMVFGGGAGISAQERDPGKDELSASVKTQQEAGGPQTANLPAAGSSQLLELQGINVCCFSHPGSHTVLAARTKTHTHAHTCTRTRTTPPPRLP